MKSKHHFSALHVYKGSVIPARSSCHKDCAHSCMLIGAQLCVCGWQYHMFVLVSTNPVKWMNYHFSILYNLPTQPPIPFVPTENVLKKLNDFLKQQGFVVWSKCYSNRNIYGISLGLFSMGVYRCHHEKEIFAEFVDTREKLFIRRRKLLVMMRKTTGSASDVCYLYVLMSPLLFKKSSWRNDSLWNY